MKKNILLGCMMLVGLTLLSCSNVEIPAGVSSEKFSDLTYTVSGRNVTLNWSLPKDTALSGVRITLNDSATIEVDSVVNSYTFKHVPVNQPLYYTVKAEYSDGRVSEGQTVFLNVPYQTNAKVGYLIPYNSINEIEDDDEKAAAEWFLSNYSNGVILTPDSLSSLNPTNYSVVWINIDRVGINVGYKNLPADLVTDEAISDLKNYYDAGGNLFLTKDATQLIAAIGRINAKFAPGLFSSGAGSTNNDIWATNAVIGSGQDKSYDHRPHAIFSGLTTDTSVYGYETYPLLGPGWKEDHSCMWDLNSYGLTTSDGDNVVLAFQNVTNSTVLATWGQVVDYCCGGIIEYPPIGEIYGRCIAIGLSAYEWNQNSGTNIYQSNIEKLTMNSLNYL